MPLYKSIQLSSSILIHIWRIAETEAQLSKEIVLTTHCQERMRRMKSEMHRKGFLSIRHLMAVSGYVDHDLFYDSFGKPHLKDGKKISITHSNQFTAIIISDSNEVGIDIEKQRDKILRIAHKFTPIEEYRTIANTEALIRKLTIVWGCKESLYKIYAEPGLSFLNHINIHDFSLTDMRTTGEIHYEGISTSYEIGFEEFEGFTLVSAVAKK